MADVYSNIDEMIDLLRSQAALMRQLKTALMLGELLGISPKNMTGPVRHVAFDLDYHSVHRWKGMVLRVTYDGVTKDFPLVEVPYDFWPATVLTDYKGYVKRTNTNKE